MNFLVANFYQKTTSFSKIVDPLRILFDQQRQDLLGTATNAALLSASGLLAGTLNKARNSLSKLVSSLRVIGK